MQGDEMDVEKGEQSIRKTGETREGGENLKKETKKGGRR